MKKFMMIFVMILFSLSLIGGSSLLIYNNLAIEAPNNAGGGVEDGEPDDPSSANATISGLWSSYWANPCLNGSGTSADPYIISSARQLAGLAYYSNSSDYYSKVRTSYFKLGANIDLSEHYWVPIGINYSFSGDFDGNGYVISGMTCLLDDSMVSNYRSVTSVYAGLFGYVSYSSSSCGLHKIVVSQPNIKITTSDSVSTFCVGAIAGYISGCYNSSSQCTAFEKCAVVDGSITNSVTMYGNKRIGGLVGCASLLMNFSECFNQGCFITTSSSMTMDAASSCYAGGLVGYILNSDIKDSYCNETMYAYSFYFAGGIVGYSSSTNISGCYFYSKYTSYMGCGAYGGGIAGYFWGGAIKSCFVQGAISYSSSFTYSGTKYYASIVGYLTSGSVYSCCWNNTDVGYGYGGGTWSNNNRYTISNAITSDPSAFFTSSSYLNNTGGYTWSIQQNLFTTVYTWNYGFTSVNNQYPVLSWALKSVSLSVSSTAGGSIIYSSLVHASSNLGTSGYAVIGDEITIKAAANTLYRLSYFMNQRTNTTMTPSAGYVDILVSDHIQVQAVFTFIGYWSSYYDSPISSGSGTSDDPYLISTARQLAGLAYYSNSSSYYSQVQSAYFKLTTSIDLGDHFWIPIGLKSEYKFLGNFDGNGYIIKNMRCYMASATDENYQMTTASRGMGLFGYVGGGATIQNFVLSGVDISTASVTYGSLNYWFGGLAAYIEGNSSTRVTITQVGVQGSIYNNLIGLSTSYRQIIGGISGYASYADISKCFNSARLQKTSSTGAGSDIWWSCGGIVGYMMYTTIDNSYNNGYIYYPVGYGGGIAGYSSGSTSIYSIISRCYSACISVVSSSGGYVTPWGSPYLGYKYGGGLVGYGGYAKVYSSFSTLQPILGSSTSTTSYGAGIVGYATSTFYAYGCAYNENCGNICIVGTSSNISATEISTENQKTYLTSKAKSYFYTSSTYLAKDTTYSWDIYQGSSSSYVWNYLVGGTTITSTPGLVYTYQSCGLPVLSWSIRRIYTNYSGSPGTITKSFHLAYPSVHSLDGSSIYNYTWTTSTNYIYGLLGQTVIGKLDSFTNEAVSFDGWGFTSSNLITTERQFEYQFDGSWDRNTLKYIYAYFTSSGVWTNYYASAFAGGSGTSSSPYEIATASQLARLAYLSNNAQNSSYYKLTADIDLSEHLWKPIGLLYLFAGNFDGGSHVISGMKCYASSYGDTNYTDGSIMYMGLFARTTNGTTIKNVILKEPNITTASTTTNSNSSYTAYTLKVGAVVAGLIGNSSSNPTCVTQCGVIDGYFNIRLQFSSTIYYLLYLGGLVGDTAYAEILKCFAQNTQILVQKQASDLAGYSSSPFVGGVVGDLYYSTMQNCYFSYNISGSPINVYACYAGGLAGRTYSGKVLNCYVYTVSGMYLGYCYAGGLVGYHNVGSYIRSCFVNSKIYLNSHPDYTTTYAGTLAGSVVSGSYVWASCWYSGMNITVAYGTNSGTVSYCTSYSTSSYATSYSATTFYTSTSYLENTNYGTAWDINYASSRSNVEIGNVWNYGLYTSYSTKYGGVNAMYPVLSWALTEVTVKAEFSGGDPYFSESNDSTCIAIRGETVTLSNRSVYSGYSFDGWYRAPAGVLSTTGLMSYDSTYELVVSDQILYYGVYNSTATQNITCHVALQYGGVVKDITQSSTYGSVSATYWIGGSPYSNGRTAASALTSRNYFLGIEKYQGYDSVVFSASSNVTGYKFFGWYMTSGSLTTGQLFNISLNGGSSSTLSYVPYSTTDINLYAIYTYDTYYTLFAGAYYSDDCGDTYTKQTSSTGTPYARFYGYSPGATSTTAYNVTTNFSYISLWSGKGVTLSSSVENYYYTFEGWYYNKTWSDDPSVFVSGATCFSSDGITGFTGTSSSVFAGKYIFAKFVRKTPEITINVMTSEDGLTFTNSVAGGKPTISYYDINLTDASTSDITSATSSVIVLAGTELSVLPLDDDKTYGATTGYVFMGITASTSCPKDIMAPTTSVTLGYSDVTYYVYYSKFSTNVLKYDKTENYYYFEDGYMPQTYAGMFSDTLNEDITNNGTLIGEGYESLKDALYEYQLASYNGYYYLGITAPQTMTLYLESATVRFSQQSTTHRNFGYHFEKGTLYWFRFEPIRWRITDYGVSPEEWVYYGDCNTNYTVVSDSVLWYDALHLANTKEGWSSYFMQFFNELMKNDDEKNDDWTFLNMMNTFATTSSNKFLYSGTNDVDYQYFGPAGQQEIVKSRSWTSSYSLTMTNKYTSGDTSSLRIASLDEITDTVGDTKARASCLVAFLMGMSNCKEYSGDVIYSKYWTRDLGNNLNAGLAIDKNGNIKSEWLSNCNGIRFAYTMSEGSSYGAMITQSQASNS